MESSSVVLERHLTPRGELVLRQNEGHFEVISNGVFLMDTRCGESERLLVRAALDAVPAGTRLLLGGLGVGFSLVEALRSATLTEIVVVEVEPLIASWHSTYLAPFSQRALHDPRVRLIIADLVTWLAASTEEFDAVCVDIDNGPQWTVTDHNMRLYDDGGTQLLRSRLAPGGVLGVWSASRSPAYERRLARTVGPVRTVAVDVRRGEPDLVYLAQTCRV